jgi:prepilin-type N-terminal cleavage/methylation domain-containing protein
MSRTNHLKKHTSGFSLLELSIVIVIVGLLMVGITSGSHLLQASNINKTISEITGYVQATNTFKEKYKALPGDMRDATSQWGSAVTDGNGNEQIIGVTTEALGVWEQMALSGLISGSYSGVSAGTQNFEIGTNVPGSVTPGAHYFLYYFSAASTTAAVYGTSGTALQLGAANATTSPFISILTPSDAHTIDTKMDDGIASTGNVYSMISNNNGTTNTSTACVDHDYGFTTATVNYILTDTATSCRLLYWIDKQ